MRWGGKWNHLPMTVRLTTDYAKNYCNQTLIVKVIVENVVTCFYGTQCRYIRARKVPTFWYKINWSHNIVSRQCPISCRKLLSKRARRFSWRGLCLTVESRRKTRCDWLTSRSTGQSRKWRGEWNERHLDETDAACRGVRAQWIPLRHCSIITQPSNKTNIKHDGQRHRRAIRTTINSLLAHSFCLWQILDKSM